jgi:hypothetical protein
MSSLLPRLQKLVPLQDMVLAASFGGGGHSIVDYSADEAGLYISGVSNDFGTSLAARGPRADLEVLARELQRGRPALDASAGEPAILPASPGLDFD